MCLPKGHRGCVDIDSIKQEWNIWALLVVMGERNSSVACTMFLMLL